MKKLLAGFIIFFIFLGFVFQVVSERRELDSSFGSMAVLSDFRGWEAIRGNEKLSFHPSLSPKDIGVKEVDIENLFKVFVADVKTFKGPINSIGLIRGNGHIAVSVFVRAIPYSVISDINGGRRAFIEEYNFKGWNVSRRVDIFSRNIGAQVGSKFTFGVSFGFAKRKPSHIGGAFGFINSNAEKHQAEKSRNIAHHCYVGHCPLSAKVATAYLAGNIMAILIGLFGFVFGVYCRVKLNIVEGSYIGGAGAFLVIMCLCFIIG